MPHPIPKNPANRGDRPDFAALLNELRELRSRVLAQGRDMLAHWGYDGRAPVGHGAALDNLAHYLALRQVDLAATQRRLQALGLSSLGRSEAKVMTVLDALIATLERLAGFSPGPYPNLAAMEEGDRALRAGRDAMFGGGPDDPYTRIMVTLPTEAAEEPDLARRLVHAGMNCARVNCAHDSPAIWRAMIDNVRRAAAEANSNCHVFMDVPGPKCRVAELAGAGRRRIAKGDEIFLVDRMANAPRHGVSIVCNFPRVVDRLALRDEMWINDGRIGARAVSRGEGRVKFEIFAARAKGERIKLEKGLNFPNVDLGLPTLTPEDFSALDFIAEHADVVGFSFVQTTQDVELLQDHLAARRGDRPPLPTVLKIETPAAVHNLPQLIATSARRNPTGVMIARGDLGVELGFQRLSEIQEELLWLCEAAHAPVVWATQVLDNLVKDGLPSRAETTDAAMAQRSECVMLNKGPCVVEAVAFLRDVLRRLDRHQMKKFARFGPLHAWE